MTDLTERETIIVDLIRAAALAGDKCPTNVAMGLALGCNGTGTSQGLILDLERKGVITFERRGNIRRATIVAEGLSTVALPPPYKRPESRKQQKARINSQLEHDGPLRAMSSRQAASSSRRFGLGNLGDIRSLRGADGPAPKECRYIKSEDTHDPDYCNEPVQAGSSYCPGHHSRCYIKRRPREDGKGEFSFRPLIVDAA